MQLKDKNAIVTGSAQGIGKSIALALAKAGANIVVSDVNIEEAEKTAKEIEALGRKALAVKCNVADANEVSELVKKTQETFDTIDILVNNAGVTRDNLMMRMEEKDWDLVLDVNLKGAFLLTKAVSRIMMKQRQGRIVNMSSVIGVMGNAGQSNYAASKGGLIAFTKSTAKEFASRNITCNAIAPGFIETAMTAKLTEEVKENYKKGIPLGRMGSVDDVANAVMFLVSEQASYITGQVLHVDGGLVM
ncbi:MAG: 3-oxoacyl-[acyl-carrier-protein] reductase [Candidatus Edwardsbacteria bacterium RIFOXYD12_FULL_50_11]|uniref:3-oxoacyl-[acyl-carrier-protein] reductase n=1 Tax=Candidatus Edwardsbacteria bacterium GWF2_54_11 TaxID=1817851 RepID=A0A1F5R4J3_9BACT|nr:MAG: 3-oxoacyl-[acyl-carrier-protein] reductase [Candidatus Edwardsbacteria bacterium RifOxyC12_full_54_24]OGF06954.1 MAG: 3-oxoacyl-[acyl-carrier-protein] reductase [Candidatus Edwardsbacteria bacterium RifOxyA12_full_54_48]OGF08943.1 MAG: 3-oxoacyl-[acyl-carrier-protein] reductase [Candidatus Edwardsbacteria bacterium GWF2_54_11]OGF11091.1 MAG: 3-oxoacyl-[acyl-carrier-protein] reductase [Candidatus Edwardsbacteria bacterium GWE2_54_12]OGF15630.1 MAG: 3-oxoacyl-[acyl-carrier-protein] reduct